MTRGMRDQRLKPCAEGCGEMTHGKRCMACFKKIPARERAGSFGKFQLKRSHLQTDLPPIDDDESEEH